eukprot:Phypoly_transcript_04180.p1 GENE.Phypoly_transcript_04180~~Phypoly_transcript_04180.p1  ORF type:complete len:532 (+),score=77.32 Phypoly_transcript_04180:116-1711(+)
MANPFLIVVTVILALAIIAGSIYVLIYFQHPEDKLVAWGPKVVVVLSLSLCCFSVLMLPLDVANQRVGGFPMTVLWLVVYITMAALVVVVIPFAAFYYEGDEYDETGKAPSQIAAAIKGTLISIIVFAVISVVMYIPLGIAEIPCIELTNSFKTVSLPTIDLNYTQPDGTVVTEPLDHCNPNNTYNHTEYFNHTYPNGTVVLESNTTVLYNDTCFYASPIADFPGNLTRHHTLVKFRVSFALWIVSIIVFFGWVLFIIFGGIGMVALPMDCIASWKRRPVRISLEKYTVRKKEIGEQATMLIEKGKAIQDRQKRGKETRRDRRNYNKFRQAVFLLEEDYERLQECYKRQGGKLILHFLVFIFGILSVGLTILWWLHIILYMITYPFPFTPFLNTIVIGLDDALGLLGTAAYGLFSFYLLLCCIKGNFKFGMRFFFFPIHPMRVGNTLMHAFLFNVALILICSFAVTQFCTLAFANYTSRTEINSLFALSVNNLKGLKYIFLGYYYALFIMVVFTGIYFALKPRDKPAKMDF